MLHSNSQRVKNALPPVVATLFFVLVLLGITHTVLADDSYGDWRSVPGHTGVDFCVRCDASSFADGKYMWWVKFRNRYNKRVTFNFRITRPNNQPNSYSDGVDMQPGDTQEGWNMVAVAPGGTVSVWTDSFKFVDANGN